MALIVDPGTFVVGNTFVEIAFADNFHVSRKNNPWIQATVEDKEAALVRAFDYFTVQNWKSDAFLLGIPLRVKNAQCIAALKELSSPGAMQPDITPGVKKESIDGAVSTEYFEDQGGGGTVYTAVNNMIKPFLKRPGMQMKLVRG